MTRLLINAKTAGVLASGTLLGFAIFQSVAAANLRTAALNGLGDSLTRDQLNSLHFSSVLTSASFTLGCFAVAIGVFTVFARKAGLLHQGAEAA